MRKLVLGLVVLSFALTATPAGAKHKPPTPLTWREANASCAVACPYWIDDLNTDLDGDGRSDVYHDPCAQPDLVEGQAGGSGRTYWQDIQWVAPFPAEFFTMRIFPLIDWDSWICAPNGEELAAGANILGENCDNVIGQDNPVPMGCQETIVIPVVPGRRYHLRAFNWSDLPGAVQPLQGNYEVHCIISTC